MRTMLENNYTGIAAGYHHTNTNVTHRHARCHWPRSARCYDGHSVTLSHHLLRTPALCRRPGCETLTKQYVYACVYVIIYLCSFGLNNAF